MSVDVRCDKCGRPAVMSYELSSDIPYSMGTLLRIDLCTACAEDLDAWISSPRSFMGLAGKNDNE